RAEANRRPKTAPGRLPARGKPPRRRRRRPRRLEGAGRRRARPHAEDSSLGLIPTPLRALELVVLLLVQTLEPAALGERAGEERPLVLQHLVEVLAPDDRDEPLGHGRPPWDRRVRATPVPGRQPSGTTRSTPVGRDQGEDAEGRGHRVA